MTTNELIGRGSVPFMQRTKTWLILYVLGIAVLVLSLWRSEGMPSKPVQLPATASQPSEMIRP